MVSKSFFCSESGNLYDENMVLLHNRSIASIDEKDSFNSVSKKKHLRHDLNMGRTFTPPAVITTIDSADAKLTFSISLPMS